MPVADAGAAGVNVSSSSVASIASFVAPPPASESATIFAVPFVGAEVHVPAPRVMPVAVFVAMTVSTVSPVKLASNQSFVTRVFPSNPAALTVKAQHAAIAAAKIDAVLRNM